MAEVYEQDPLLRQYLDFHYRGGGDDYLPLHPLPPGVLDYPRRCADKLIANSTSFARALDLGCAVGGASFRLARAFDEVVGLDFSAAFIRAARSLAETGTFRLSEEAYHPPSEVRKCVPDFREGDACAPAQDLGRFDALLLANLLCRLPDPAAALQALRGISRPGALILITTPCSWDEAFTPREKWLWPTLEGLHHHLDAWCECLEISEMPFVLRDHPRRAQFTVAQASLWRVKTNLI